MRDTIMWIGGFVLAVIAAGLMVWSDIGDGPLIAVGMLGILFIAVGARVDEASTASQHACRYRRVNRSVQAVRTAGYGEWFPRLPAHSSCDFRWSLHHFRRDLSRWRCTMERLSDGERSELWDWWEAGDSQRAIARTLDRSRSTTRTRIGRRTTQPGPRSSCDADDPHVSDPRCHLLSRSEVSPSHRHSARLHRHGRIRGRSERRRRGVLGDRRWTSPAPSRRLHGSARLPVLDRATRRHSDPGVRAASRPCVDNPGRRVDSCRDALSRVPPRPVDHCSGTHSASGRHLKALAFLRNRAATSDRNEAIGVDPDPHRGHQIERRARWTRDGGPHRPIRDARKPLRM